MRPVLANLGSYDHPNLRSFTPEDPAEVAFHMFLDVGRKGQKGTTQFTLFVGTPKGLLALRNEDSNIIKFGKVLIVERYDFDQLQHWAEAKIRACEGSTWEEILDKIRRQFDWEHEYDR